MIKVSFLPPTNSLGPRFKAVGFHGHVTIDADDRCDDGENAMRAAHAYAREYFDLTTMSMLVHEEGEAPVAYIGDIPGSNGVRAYVTRAAMERALASMSKSKEAV